MIPVARRCADDGFASFGAVTKQQQQRRHAPAATYHTTILKRATALLEPHVRHGDDAAGCSRNVKTRVKNTFDAVIGRPRHDLPLRRMVCVTRVSRAPRDISLLPAAVVDAASPER